MLPAIEFSVLAFLAVMSAVIGYVATERYVFLKIPVLIIGIILISFSILPALFPARFYFLYPSHFLGEAALACAFMLSGVLASRYSDTFIRRILQGLLLVAMTYFILAVPGFFAFRADYIRSLDHKVKDGVTIQASFFGCVPSSIATALRLWGLEYKEGEVAYELRTTPFQGTAYNRIPKVVEKLGADKRLQAKFVHTDFAELKTLNAPAILFAYSGTIPHANTLMGMVKSNVVIGEPLSGRLEMPIDEYLERRKWTGLAVIIAPDFLYQYSLESKHPRAQDLLEKMRILNVPQTEQGLRALQKDHGIDDSGDIDWKTILVIDSLSPAADRAKLSEATLETIGSL